MVIEGRNSVAVKRVKSKSKFKAQEELNHTSKTEGSTVQPTVMSQGLGQLHVVFPRVPVLVHFSS